MKRTAAFTLVELSIVLVILGLLVGGVLTGQSLIKAAELRAVTNEYSGYKLALNAFREKYNAFPGDMPNAVRFWGAADGGTADGPDATCDAVATAAVGTETCNGDGSGLLQSLGVWAPVTEYWRAWQHLSNAGLIEGKYSGVQGAGGYQDIEVGINVPRSRFPASAWAMVSYGSGPFIWAGYFPRDYGNVLYFGGEYPDLINYTDTLVAGEAFNIDTKADDGKPNTGRILTHDHTVRPDCITGTDDAYQLSSTIPGCTLLFLL